MHVGGLIDIDINDDLKNPKIIYIDDVLNESERDLAMSILVEYHKLFSFSYDDMSRLHPNLVVHSIVTYPNAKPIKKKLRKVNPPQSLFIKDELQNIFKDRFIESIDYPKWVSNMVPISKPDGHIYICIYFCYLNRACPKDEFHLSNIDILVDNTSRYEISIMDDFLGYNQIWVNPNDQHKIAFTTPWVTYYYRFMPFDLKNIGATYQRAMTYIFHDMMHDIMEDYVDDLLAKYKICKLR